MCFFFMENPLKHGMIWGENPVFPEISIYLSVKPLFILVALAGASVPEQAFLTGLISGFTSMGLVHSSMTLESPIRINKNNHELLRW